MQVDTFKCVNKFHFTATAGLGLARILTLFLSFYLSFHYLMCSVINSDDLY